MVPGIRNFRRAVVLCNCFDDRRQLNMFLFRRYGGFGLGLVGEAHAFRT